MSLAKAIVGGTPRVIDLRRTGRIITGNFKSYAVGVYGAFTGMWGHYLPQNNTLIADSTMRVQPATFPKATTFTWDVTRDPDWGGVVGFLHLSWGNYDDSPGVITPRQVSAITALSVNIDWTTTGDDASGLLSECWLSPVSTPSGPPTRLHEVAFFPKVSATGASYLASLAAVGGGSFTDSNGIGWNVREDVSGTGEPYYIAYRPGYVDFRGALPYKDFFTFLVGAGKIANTEWFNGLAFGVEPYSGAGTFTITNFTPTYTGA